MKKLVVFAFAATLTACGTGDTASTDGMKDSSNPAGTSTTAVSYPYTIEHPDYWEIGTTANSLVALNSLKKWEEGNIDESLTYFGDSVLVNFDALEKKMSNDSLKAMLGGGRDIYKTVKIRMDDWESVISKDKKDEWVTLWYIQSWETQKGEKDSVAVINDIKLKDGKIIQLDEYKRMLH